MADLTASHEVGLGESAEKALPVQLSAAGGVAR